MGRAFSGLLLVTAILGGASIVHLASGQEVTRYPGQSTQARVWIENRGPSDAVPVNVEAVGADVLPLPVEISGAPAIRIDSASVIEARRSRQQWEYQSIAIPTGTDAAPALNMAGADGWEAIGLVFASNQGSVVVMKRPR